MERRKFYIEYKIGEIIGNCEFLGDAGYRVDKNTGKSRRLGKFKCKCGKEFVTSISNVKRGNTTSCGCYNRKKVIENATTHGLSKHPLYGQWQNIKNRCNNPNIDGYELYGGRGIKVCEQWMSDFLPFYNWAIENNWKRGLSVDRIDVNGNYCKENCRLATDKEQGRNKRNNSIVEYNGKKICISELCDNLGLRYDTIRTRINKLGWSVERAISTETRTDRNNRLNNVDESREFQYYTTF